MKMKKNSLPLATASTMRANPGGEIDSREIVGRDAFIADLWHILRRQSVVLHAERRQGKTCVIKKMRSAPPPELIPIYSDVEGLVTALEFVEQIFAQVENYLSTRRRVAAQTRQFLQSMTGAEWRGLKLPQALAPHWKELLRTIIADLAEHRGAHVVFFWDEFPLMLQNIRQRQGPEIAMELLDILRTLRHTHSSLRMVYSGSIGLHHVIRTLRSAGYTNDPTNDMLLVEIEPLALEEAAALAAALLRGEKIPLTDCDAVARAIARGVDSVPYYIHHIVDYLRRKGGVATEARIAELIDECLTHDLDLWHMAHYRHRLDEYYPAEHLPLLLAILDTLALADSPLPFPTLCEALQQQLQRVDPENVRLQLRTLQRDHYLTQRATSYTFRFSLLRRWWRFHRGI